MITPVARACAEDHKNGIRFKNTKYQFQGKKEGRKMGKINWYNAERKRKEVAENTKNMLKLGIVNSREHNTLLLIANKLSYEENYSLNEVLKTMINMKTQIMILKAE